MAKQYTLSYKKDVIRIWITVDKHSIVGDVKVRAKGFVATIGAINVLEDLIKINEAKTRRDIKLLALHIIEKCTPYGFELNHNDIADKNIIKITRVDSLKIYMAN